MTAVVEHVNSTLEQGSLAMEMSREPEPELKLDLEACEEIKITDEWGKLTRFGDLFQEKKTIVILIRHFLCYTAKEYVEDLNKIPERYLLDADVRLVVIGCGPSKFIHPFREATGYRHELYTDPDRQLYRAFNCADKPQPGKVKSSIHVKSNMFMGVMKSVWRSMQYKEFQGDMEQLGGSFILGPGTEQHYIHCDRYPTDHSPINDLLCIAGVEQVNFDGDTRVMSL